MEQQQLLGKRRLPDNSSGDEEDSETSDDTWNPSEEEEEDNGGVEDNGDSGGGVRTRSRGPAEVVPEAADAMDKVDEAVDQESDFSSSTEVILFFCLHCLRCFLIFCSRRTMRRTMSLW